MRLTNYEKKAKKLILQGRLLMLGMLLNCLLIGAIAYLIGNV